VQSATTPPQPTAHHQPYLRLGLGFSILLGRNTVIRHNWTIGAPVKRSLIAYDH
jgi:hypothetical protein